MNQCNNNSYATQPVIPLLWKTTLPMFVPVLALLGYDFLEASLLANRSEQVLTIFTYSLPITTAMVALSIGISIQSNAKMVHISCTNKQHLKGEIIQQLLKGSTLVVIAALLLYLITPLLFLTLEPQSNKLFDYLNYRYFGWLFLACFWQSNAILRALGWLNAASKLMLLWLLTKSMLVSFAFLSNDSISLPPLTTIASIHLLIDFIFAILSLWMLFTKTAITPKHLLNVGKQFFSKKTGLKNKTTVNTSLVVLQQLITPISMAALTAIAATFNPMLLSTLGLIFRLELLLLILPMVLTTTLPAIIGANYWLKKSVRVEQIYLVAFISIAAFQLAIALLLFTQSELLSQLLCCHKSISMQLNNYFNWVPWSYFALGILITLQSCLNAQYKIKQATALAVFYRIILLLPITLIATWYDNDMGFYHGLFISNVTALIMVIFFKFHLTKIKSSYLKTEGLTAHS